MHVHACALKRIWRPSGPLYKWRLNLNNNTHISKASHSCEKSFVWKHEHEAKGYHVFTERKYGIIIFIFLEIRDNHLSSNSEAKPNFYFQLDLLSVKNGLTGK